MKYFLIIFGTVILTSLVLIGIPEMFVLVVALLLTIALVGEMMA